MRKDKNTTVKFRTKKTLKHLLMVGGENITVSNYLTKKTQQISLPAWILSVLYPSCTWCRYVVLFIQTLERGENSKLQAPRKMMLSAG